MMAAALSGIGKPRCAGEGKLSNTEDLNNLLGCKPIKFSSVAEELARRQANRGQCEIHAWIAPCNAQWFAGILREAYFDCQFLRPAQGWEGVIDLLESSPKSEIVMSYSVCEGFPNPSLSGISYEDWINLSETQQWQSSMGAIRDGREIKPETWDDYTYGDGWDLFRLNSLIGSSSESSSCIGF